MSDEQRPTQTNAPRFTRETFKAPPYRTFEVEFRKGNTFTRTTVTAHGIHVEPSGALTFGEVFWNTYLDMPQTRMFRSFAPGVWLEYRETTPAASSGTTLLQ